MTEFSELLGIELASEDGATPFGDIQCTLFDLFVRFLDLVIVFVPE